MVQFAPGANFPTHPFDATTKPSLTAGSAKVTEVSPVWLVTVTLSGLLGWPKSPKGWSGNKIEVGLISMLLTTGLAVPLGVGVVVGVGREVAVEVTEAVGVVVEVVVVAVGVLVAAVEEALAVAVGVIVGVDVFVAVAVGV